MPLDEFEIIAPDDIPPHRKTRGPYKKNREPSELNFTVLDEFEIGKAESDVLQPAIDEVLDFEVLTPEQVRIHEFRFPTNKQKRALRPVIFIDGEGANYGDPAITTRKQTLHRWVQIQNYALLGVVYRKLDNPTEFEYRYLESPDHTSQLGTRECLDFILSLPETHIIVGFALTYDIEMWLRQISPDQMRELLEIGKTWWKHYLIHYIPKKRFAVIKYNHRKRVAGRVIYDAHGFFQTSFRTAIEDWKVGTKEEWDFIERMKKARGDFGPITEETKAYNRMEGIHGVQMFERVRREYTNLDLSLPHPVGAGSIASAIFRKHRIRDFYPAIHLLPLHIMHSGFIGGRFDISEIGFVGDIIESDINSAYPFIARGLPCLSHSRYIPTTTYSSDPNSLWLVSWKDNGTRWSPFPYRIGNHIRYYQDGIGWYYGVEVREALLFDPTIQILAGFNLERECDHQPFSFIDEYYQRREEMKKVGDFGEKIIKLGLNSIYGKLAQSKGKNPPFQQWIWAGMITSGTRAMLMSAIRQNPNAIVAVATDAVFSKVPLRLDYDEVRLGAWKQETLYDLLILGNGVYHSIGSSNPKHAHGVHRHRGFLEERFNWEEVRENYRNGITTILKKYEFRQFAKAFHERRMSERCDWVTTEVELKLDTQKAKRIENGLVYPMPNPTPLDISAPVKVRNENEIEED